MENYNGMVNKQEYLEAMWRFLREENVSLAKFALRLEASRQYLSQAFSSGKASYKLMLRLTDEINKLAEERSRPERFTLEIKGEIVISEDCKGEPPRKGMD